MTTLLTLLWLVAEEELVSKLDEDEMRSPDDVEADVEGPLDDALLEDGLTVGLWVEAVDVKDAMIVEDIEDVEGL